MGTDVSVVVSYNTRDLPRQRLQSVFASRHRPAEVFVLDNPLADGSEAMVAAEFFEAMLVALDRNLGFGSDINVALRRCRADTFLCATPTPFWNLKTWAPCSPPGNCHCVPVDSLLVETKLRYERKKYSMHTAMAAAAVRGPDS